MESLPTSVEAYYTSEREAVSGEFEKRAKKHDKKALALRTESSSAWRSELSDRASELRSQGEYVGSLHQSLLHYYGSELQDEVLAELGYNGTSDSKWEDFFEAVAPLESATDLTPVIINSPQYVSFVEGPSEWREYMFVLVDPTHPFYARRIEFNEAGMVIDSVSGSDEEPVRQLRSFGLSGSYAAISTSIDERSIGGIEGGRMTVTGGDGELLIADEKLRNGKVYHGMYRSESRAKNIITSSSDRQVEYTVGWNQIEDLLYAEKAGERRNAAARIVGRYLLPSSIEPQEVMPRAGQIVDAVRALDRVTRD